MLNKEVIEQLKSLKAHCESMKESGEEWEKDVQALEYAIKELERTAQEVPVQEQLCEINKKVNSIQICLTIYSVTLITMLITILFD